MTAVDDGVLGMELAVRLLEGLGDTLDPLDDGHGLEQEGVDLRGVADDANDRLVVALRHVRLEAASLDPRYNVSELLLSRRLLDHRYHGPPPCVALFMKQI